MKYKRFGAWLKSKINEDMGQIGPQQKKSNELVAQAVTDVAGSQPDLDPAQVMKDPKLKSKVVVAATQSANKQGVDVDVADVVAATDGEEKKMKRKMKK